MIPNIVYICYIFANLGNIAWVFLWDRELIVASGILIALIAAALLIATAYSLVGQYSVACPFQIDDLYDLHHNGRVLS